MRKGKLFFQISRVFYLPIYYKGIKKQDYTVYQYNPVYHFPVYHLFLYLRMSHLALNIKEVKRDTHVKESDVSK